MIIEKRIKNFENLGFGMFVHFGIYSLLGKGEWVKHIYSIPDEEYEKLTKEFDPEKDWAEKLVLAAKNAGCKYITLTSRHHDGFSLYDTKGLSDYDAVHAKCGRDLIKEFVDACNKEKIKPFFYHTLLDWHVKEYKENFPKYLEYLRRSVEILCTNYGKIGGLWFDGMWDKPQANWEEDALYSTIRKHQPEAMIINNTGLSERGKLGHIELDSVTFERGRPEPINLSDSPKYIASEMCQTLGDTWGYGAGDINYKSPETLIKDLCICRKFGANLLLNVGPMGNGLLRPLDTELLKCMGIWTENYGEAIRSPRPTDIKIENKTEDFILKGENAYYLFAYDLGMSGDGNVVEFNGRLNYEFILPEKPKKIYTLDSKKEIDFTEENGKISFTALPYPYGTNHIVRVIKIEI